MPADKVINPAIAANAYMNTARITPINTGATQAGQSFSDFLSQGVEKALGSIKGGEQMSAKAIAGTADMTDVVQAVTSAELTLQTVVSIRDRLVGAYQDLMRMPI